MFVGDYNRTLTVALNTKKNQIKSTEHYGRHFNIQQLTLI